MLIVGERINSSRPAIKQAIESKDSHFICSEAKAQTEAGAHYIDINTGTFIGQETHYLCWLVETVQGGTELPLCIDSVNPEAVAAALEIVKRVPMINSITLEEKRMLGMIPLVKTYKTKIVALCQSDAGIANEVNDKIKIAEQIVQALTVEGIALDDIYIDPLVYPIATDTRSALVTLKAIEEIKQSFPEVHTICGLSNVSFGLPARRFINRAFLVTAMFSGLDSVILDPTDNEVMANLLATSALLNRDEFCLTYINAYQDGKLF